MRPPGVRPSVFFALTFALSWAIWVPLLLAHYSLIAWPFPESLGALLRLLGVLMPGTVALILAGRTAGRAGQRQVLGRLGIWRVGWRWWAAAVLIQPAMVVVTGMLFNAFGGQPQVVMGPPLSLGVLVVQTVFLLLATLGEEIGWRGLALPELQQHVSPLRASLVLGLLWATWHVPFWLLLGTLEQFGAGYLALNFLFFIAGNIYITWFFNHGRGSLLLPVAFHLAFNLVNVLWLPVTASKGAYAWLVAAECVLAILLVPHLAPRPRPITAYAAP
jgi:membrane protease YdiL (CAAX protease family)